MSFFRPQSLQAKFLIGLAVFALAFGIFFFTSLYFHLRSLLHTQVVDKAELVLTQVDSVQGYVREVLRPRMYNVLQADSFMIESMSSSFISRQIMDRLKLSRSEYHYRRVAENARNPDSEVNGLERELLERFRADPTLRNWEGYRELDGGQYFVRARPVRFTRRCMYCHGSPENAPRELLAKYGNERGFGHVAGAVDGLDLVGLPVQQPMSRIRGATVGYVGIYASGMLFFFAVIQFFFNRLVVHNLHRLSSFFRGRFHDRVDFKVLEKLGRGDEIEEMLRGMEEMGDALLDAQTRLADYASNLERMVEERTEELSIEARERRSDVGLFVELLDGLNKSQTRKELWTRALPSICERFKAARGAFICTLSSGRFYAWPEASHRPELPPEHREALLEARTIFFERSAIIPVGASEAVTEGLLHLEWDDGPPRRGQDRDVLRALGQQLGIAMENLAALDNLVRQKDVLQSVVEGISDPLLLMDGSCHVLLANQAARELAGSLAAADAKPGEESLQSLVPRLLGGEDTAECPFKGAVVTGRPYQREVHDQGHRSFSLSVYPWSDDGNDGRIVVYIRENTAEKRMLASMQQSEKLATVGKLAAGLAHEMNNPLGVILCYAELLRSGLVGTEHAGDVEVVIKHTKQAQSVLQDLLNFARTKSSSLEDIDLAQVVREVTGVLALQAESRKARLEVSLPDGLPAVRANRQWLEQILTNLLNNAFDAMEANGASRPRLTRVEAEAVNGEVLLRVRDTGPGIARAHLGQIFDPFFTTKEVGRGTGLGLAVVYGLVREMGAGIDVEGREGAGAVFSLRLPLGSEREPRVSGSQT